MYFNKFVLQSNFSCKHFIIFNLHNFITLKDNIFLLDPLLIAIPEMNNSFPKF